MAMVYMNGKMVTDMKVNGRCVLDMDKALIHLQMVTFILVSTAMAKPTAMVNTDG
jgi:hypothetical protein